MLIVTITGASGAGKSILENALVSHFGGGRIITITTRPQRKDEIAGVHNHFETKAEIMAHKDLLWNLVIHGCHRYAASESAFYSHPKTNT